MSKFFLPGYHKTYTLWIKILRKKRTLAKSVVRTFIYFVPQLRRKVTFSEVTLKERRLVILDLSVLHGNPAQRVVELDRLDGGGAGLVLRGLRAQPEVEVPRQAAPALIGLVRRKEKTFFLRNIQKCVISNAQMSRTTASVAHESHFLRKLSVILARQTCLEHDVRVSSVKFAIARLVVRHRLEILYRDVQKLTNAWLKPHLSSSPRPSRSPVQLLDQHPRRTC